MKFRHILAIMLFVAVALGTAGCKGEYYFDFAEEGALNDENGLWTVRENPLLCYFLPEGLRMEDVNLACPKMFSGDFTITVVFDLMVNSENRFNFGIILCDGDFYFDSENDVHMDFYGAGSVAESFDIYDHDDIGNSVDHDSSVTSVLFDELVRDGENSWVISKAGDVITLSVNGHEFAQFTLGAYDSKWFCPNIYAYNSDSLNDDYGFTLRSILVSYSGSMIDR